MSELSEKVHELTRDHKVVVMQDTPDGEKRAYVDKLSLLKQLQLEMTSKSSTGSSGGSSSSKSGSLISLSALTLWDEIDGVSSKYISRQVPLATRIQRWAQEATGDAQRESECLAWVKYWCDTIEGLQESTLDVYGICPDCGAVEYLKQDENESTQVIRMATFVANIHGAVCRVCGAEWLGMDNMRKLRQLI